MPVHDDRKWFEFLLLEGVQAGLSWFLILKKRENYRQAYDGFDFDKVARYGEKKIARLLADPGLIRNRAKISGLGGQCQGVYQHQGGIRQFRQLYLAICRG